MEEELTVPEQDPQQQPANPYAGEDQDIVDRESEESFPASDAPPPQRDPDSNTGRE